MPSAKHTSTAPKQRSTRFRFIGDTIAELKKVTWLTRREIVYLTGLVLIVTLIASIIMGLIDLGFSKIVEQIIPGG